MTLLVRALLRARYAMLAFATALSTLGFYLWLAGGGFQGDLALERAAGRALFGWLPGYHGGALHLYALHPDVQIGPIPLAIMGLSTRLPGRGSQVLLAALTMSCAVACAWALERIAVNLGASQAQSRFVSLGGGLVMLGAFASVAFISHLEDAFAVTGVLLAVEAIAGRRSWWVPAVVLGIAVSCKPWAVVAVPVLLGLDRQRAWAVATVILVAFLPWAAFLIADPHTVSALGGDYNFVWPKSVLRVLGFGFGDSAPPAARSMALVVGIAFASLAAIRGRWLAVPLAGFAGRLLLETHWFMYYGALAVAGALVWDISRRRRLPVWTLWTAFAEYGLQALIPWDNFAGAVVNLVYVLTVVALLVLPKRRQGDPLLAMSVTRHAGQVSAL